MALIINKQESPGIARAFLFIIGMEKESFASLGRWRTDRKKGRSMGFIGIRSCYSGSGRCATDHGYSLLLRRGSNFRSKGYFFVFEIYPSLGRWRTDRNKSRSLRFVAFSSGYSGSGRWATDHGYDR